MSSWPALRIHVARLIDPRRDQAVSAIDLDRSPTGKIDVHEQVPATADLHITGAEVREGEPVVVVGSVTASLDGLGFRGHIASRLHAECGRCLDDVVKDVGADVDVVFVAEHLVEQTEAADADAYPIDGDWIDLGVIVRTELMLALPLGAVCEGQCEGPAAGIDVSSTVESTEPDIEDEPAVDPRWVKLSEVTFGDD